MIQQIFQETKKKQALAVEKRNFPRKFAKYECLSCRPPVGPCISRPSVYTLKKSVSLGLWKILHGPLPPDTRHLSSASLAASRVFFSLFFLEKEARPSIPFLLARFEHVKCVFLGPRASLRGSKGDFPEGSLCKCTAEEEYFGRFFADAGRRPNYCLLERLKGLRSNS